MCKMNGSCEFPDFLKLCSISPSLYYLLQNFVIFPLLCIQSSLTSFALPLSSLIVICDQCFFAEKGEMAKVAFLFNKEKWDKNMCKNIQIWKGANNV